VTCKYVDLYRNADEVIASNAMFTDRQISIRHQLPWGNIGVNVSHPSSVEECKMKIFYARVFAARLGRSKTLCMGYLSRLLLLLGYALWASTLGPSDLWSQLWVHSVQHDGMTGTWALCDGIQLSTWAWSWLLLIPQHSWGWDARIKHCQKSNKRYMLCVLL